MDYKAIIIALLLFLSFAHTIAFGSSNISCPDSERKALLRFARGFNRTAEAEREAPLWFARDFNGTAADFSSWEGKDCCKWEGVKCDDRTGHIVHLDLQGRGIVGNRINPSLLRLKQLSYLDLSGNFFDFISIPPWIGSFKKLNYLNLSLSYFNGTVPGQLGNLSRLQTLDLSYNYHLTLSNADWLSRLTSLLHIDMSCATIDDASNWLQALNMLPLVQDIHALYGLLGNFPQSLPHVNFTSLSLLDLSWTSLYDFSNNREITPSLPDWLFGITSLQYLSLFGSGFTVLIPSAIGNLTSLKVLELDDVDINAGIPSSLSNLCELRTLSLSFSTINSQLDALEASFSGCLKSSLRELHLDGTSLSGNMLDLIGDLNNLNILDLSVGSFSGSIPTSFCKLSTLQELYINDNKINGTVPECLGKLSELRLLDLSYNSLIGVISEYHFSNLTELESIDLSSNSLILNLSYSWVPPFQLGYLGFGGCKLGPKFPSWLRTQKSLTSLDLSSTGISDSVPNWFWNSMTNLSRVYLANNELHGVLPNLVNFSDDAYLFIDLNSNFFTGPMPSFPSNTAYLDLSNNSFSGPIPYDFFHGVLPKLVTFSDDALLDIDLSSNFFEGPVPIFPSNTKELDLSDNSFMGPIPYDFFQLMPNLAVLSLSMNKINGRIPMSICNSQLTVISISNNNLSGELPNCQNNTPLEFLELSNNNLSGGVPKWLCECPSFQSLHLRKNSLSGELPLSLKTCKSLNTLDLGGNMFTGRIPIWFGELSFLKILSLKSNKFVGRIPSGLSNLTALQILDLSNNNLSGPIPMSFGNFTTMRTTLYRHHPYIRRSYDEGMILDIKGREDQYDGQLLSDVTILDLSKNSLSGCIPNELTNLLGLMVFDLSSNDLTGQIPFKIGDLTQLLYLDLSRNKLSGAIPSSLSNLTFLEILNISYNNFSGRIPTGKQMDTFVDPKIYVGNQYLCGFQINVSCTGNEGEAEGPTIGQSSHTPTNVSENADENRKEILLLCLITIAGFAVGFWAITGVLLVHKRFRIWWFRYVDSLYDSLYVISRVWFARLKKKMSKINTTDG